MKTEAMLDSNENYIKSLASKKKKAKESVSKEDKRAFAKKLGNGDEKAKEAYAEKLVENATLGVMAQLIFTDFFNQDTLEVGDPKYYTLDEPVPQGAEIMEIAMNGGTPRRAVVQDGQLVRVTPYQVTSPEVEMNKFTLRQGNISQTEKARERIERGNAHHIDLDAKNLLEAGLVNDFEAVEGIQIEDRVKNFPKTNDIDLSSEGEITLNVIKRIAKHFDQLGRQIRNVYIPSNRREDLWDWMSIPAGYDDGSEVTADSVIPAGMHENIIRTGTLNNILGYNLNLIPLNTLNGDEDEGDVHIWVTTNQAAGEFRTIPEFSDVHTDEDAKRLYFQENRAVAMFQTPNQKVNYARVKIASENV